MKKTIGRFEAPDPKAIPEDSGVRYAWLFQDEPLSLRELLVRYRAWVRINFAISLITLMATLVVAWDTFFDPLPSMYATSRDGRLLKIEPGRVE